MKEIEKSLVMKGNVLFCEKCEGEMALTLPMTVGEFIAHTTAFKLIHMASCFGCADVLDEVGEVIDNYVKEQEL